MNKKTIATTLNQKSTPIEYKDGAIAQQEATLLTTSVVNAPDISKVTTEDMIASLYALQEDLQVRDYILGIVLGGDKDKSMSLDFYRDRLGILLNLAPKNYKAAPAAILSVVHYMQGNASMAKALVKTIVPSYGLAGLLTRVYAAQWPASAFTDMTIELHPKVTATIFGENND